MIQYPEYPILGGAPSFPGVIGAFSQDDSLLTPPGGWGDEIWRTAWDSALEDLRDTFEQEFGTLQDKLYWYLTAGTDPQAPGAGYAAPAWFFHDQLNGYL